MTEKVDVASRGESPGNPLAGEPRQGAVDQGFGRILNETAARRSRSPLAAVTEGWRFFGLVSVAVAALFVAVLLASGTGEGGLRTLVRSTARTSLALFLPAFAASSLRQLWPSRFTAWLLRNRRYIGVSFAFSHLLHLVAVAWLAASFPHPFYEQSVNLVVMGGGGVTYLLIAAMAATSFDRTAAWLGARRWKVLHTVGGYSIWGVFAFDYVQFAFRSPLYIPAALAVVGTMALRQGAWVRARLTRARARAVV